MVWHLQGSEAGAAAVQAGREGREAGGGQREEPADGGPGRTGGARAAARTEERKPAGRAGEGENARSGGRGRARLRPRRTEGTRPGKRPVKKRTPGLGEEGREGAKHEGAAAWGTLAVERAGER